MTSKLVKKEIMAQARRAGWKGKSYRKAKRFDRKLSRAIAATRKAMDKFDATAFKKGKLK